MVTFSASEHELMQKTRKITGAPSALYPNGANTPDDGVFYGIKSESAHSSLDIETEGKVLERSGYRK